MTDADPPEVGATACRNCRRMRDAKGRCWHCCDRLCSRCGSLTGSALIELCIACGNLDATDPVTKTEAA